MSGKNDVGKLTELLHSVGPKYAMVFGPIMVVLSIWMTPMGITPGIFNIAIGVTGGILGVFGIPLTLYGILMFFWNLMPRLFLITLFIGLGIFIFSLFNVLHTGYEFQKNSLSIKEDCSFYQDYFSRRYCEKKYESNIGGWMVVLFLIFIFIRIEIMLFKAITRKEVRQLLDTEISKK